MTVKPTRVGLLIMMGVAGCSPMTQPPGSKDASNLATIAKPVITQVKPIKKSIKRTVEQPGTIQPFEETSIYPKLAAFVASVGVDPDKANRLEHDRGIDLGSKVKRGQVLAELSAPELLEERTQKEAIIQQVKAEVNLAKSTLAATASAINATKAQIAEAKAVSMRSQAVLDRWRSESDRVNRLVSGGVIDSQTRDETLSQLKSAEASHAESIAKVSTAEAELAKAQADQDKSAANVAATEARLAVAQAEHRRMQAMCDYLKIVAPFDGIVTRREINVGDFVSSANKKGLFSIARLNPVRAVIAIPEQDASLVDVGSTIRLLVAGNSGNAIDATVMRTSWSLEPGSRTLRAETDLPNPQGQYRPGMYLTARVTSELPANWTVPNSAMVKLNDEPCLFLLEDGVARKHVVQLSVGDHERTQIKGYRKPSATTWTEITGAELVLEPAASVTDGQKISP